MTSCYFNFTSISGMVTFLKEMWDGWFLFWTILFLEIFTKYRVKWGISLNIWCVLSSNTILYKIYEFSHCYRTESNLKCQWLGQEFRSSGVYPSPAETGEVFGQARETFDKVNPRYISGWHGQVSVYLFQLDFNWGIQMTSYQYICSVLCSQRWCHREYLYNTQLS